MNVYLYIIFFNLVIQCYSYHTCVHIPYIIKLHVTTDTLADKYLGTPWCPRPAVPNLGYAKGYATNSLWVPKNK